MKKTVVCLLILMLVFCLAGCQTKEKPEEGPAVEEKELILSTTTSTVDSGLLDKLLPVFEEKTGYEVKVLSQGTGQALKTGELGDCDVVLVHARASEDAFVEAGFGVNRKDVMYNDFVIVGPAADPAGIKGKSVAESLQAIASKKSEFISRGDDSGTHKKELELWKKVGIEPSGAWYLSVGKGMGDTLNMASEKQAYTLTDRGTYAKMKENLELDVLVEGDENMLNPYGIIAVNPEKHPGVNHEGAMALIEFITSQEAKAIIDGYKVGGQQLFFSL